MVRDWLAKVGVTTLYIEPASPWENGYVESLNGKLRDGLLNGEIFSTVKEAKVLIESWRRHYNTVRPHSSLGYRPPAPEAIAARASGPTPSAVDAAAGTPSAALRPSRRRRAKGPGLSSTLVWKPGEGQSEPCVGVQDTLAPPCFEALGLDSCVSKRNMTNAVAAPTASRACRTGNRLWLACLPCPVP